MKTLHLTINAADMCSENSRASIETAAAILREGGTVAFPTETVYGLGANALSQDAVLKIFLAKQRPQWDPLIVHVASEEMLHEVAAAISASAQKLMDTFWPGPLTVLLPKTLRVPPLVTAGRPLVGVRMPSHPVAVALIRGAGVPIAAPSANSFGRISPTLAQHVLEDLDGKIDAVLDGGETAHGLESAVVDTSGEAPMLYRSGVITLDQIRSVCPNAIAFEGAFARAEAALQSLPSPGLGMRHYAPRARLLLIDGEGEQLRKDFSSAISAAHDRAEKVGAMVPYGFLATRVRGEFSYPWGEWSKPEHLAQRLFAGLRALDAAGATVIICPLPADKGIGSAIRDRLLKAARPQ